MKIVINNCYGGFSLSPKAIKRYLELQGKNCFFFKPGWHSKNQKPKLIHDDNLDDPSGLGFYSCYTSNPPTDETLFYDRGLDRTDPILIQVVEELDKEANGIFAKLKIINIPDDVEYTIEEYDGIEYVAEKHRVWA